jgi:hypothetical protein
MWGSKRQLQKFKILHSLCIKSIYTSIFIVHYGVDHISCKTAAYFRFLCISVELGFVVIQKIITFQFSGLLKFPF